MMQNQEIFSVETLLKHLSERTRGIECIGLSGSEKAYLVSQIYRQQKLPCLVIVASGREAERFLEDLQFFMGKVDIPIHFFPPYNILPFKFLAYHSETAGNRIRALFQLMETTTPPIVITTVDALLQKIIPKSEINRYA